MMAAPCGRLLLLVAVALATEAPAPDLSMSIRRPVQVSPGRDGLLTCVVTNLGNHTLLWKRVVAAEGAERMAILTAGDYRVTKDSRVMVLHDHARKSSAEMFRGGDVFVLAIQNTTVNDTGMYVCEVNSSPVVRSYHQLTVASTGSVLAPGDTAPTTAATRTYNYTACCQRHNVTNSCIGLCSLAGLSQGHQAEGTDCEADFPSIIGCMADGRNHLSCCEEQGVPAMCSSICRGEYFAQTDSIRDHFSCIAYSQTMLNCVARGLDTLPAAPSNLRVSVRSVTELQISWSGRRTQAPPTDLYTVNVTRLRRFDGAMLGQEVNGTELEEQLGQDTQLFNVTSARMFLLAGALQPLTMYEVSVTAHNAAGRSLASDRVRAVTWVSETRNDAVSPPPGLPDVRQCCEDAGVTEPRCLRQLCDPRVASDTVVTDVIICAPWAEKTFSCMADGRDHSACCRARGLPQICVDLCAGNVTKIGFQYFRCLGFMGSYASCLMQGYGVVPTAPVDPRVALTDSNFVVLRWNPPAALADTVVSYTLRVRPSRGDNSTYMTYTEAHAPYLLEKLSPDTEYEFYLEAVNQRGAGPQSSRVIFKTMPAALLDQEATQSSYNLSTCCLLAEMSPACMPLCHYDARMSTMKGLAHICAPEYHKLLRCSAGGRDHTSCCRRRGVPDVCLPACRGEGTLISECTPFLGNLWQCYEEGTGRLPAPVTALHATAVTNSSVTLIWEEIAGNVTGFRVMYGIVNQESRQSLGMDVLDQALNVSDQFALVDNLTQNQLYAFTVVAVNEYGTSLPTSIITTNITEQGDVMQKAMTSHPHSLSVSELSATQLTVSWAPPLISHPTERIRYRVSYREPNATQYTNVTTAALSHRLEELTPNSQYSVFVTALSGMGESRPSETLQMWTSPAYPAYVELPTIHPTDMVKEGGSMTVLCIAMASPEPTVALYINGRHVTEGRTRHLVTSIRNVTRDMNQVTCYADNGYGTPMQSTRHVVISRRPVVTSRPVYTVQEGGTVSLRCKVDASPEPQMVFYRDPAQRRAVIDGGNYVITHSTSRKEGEHTMELRIKQVSAEDFGKFYCHAENVFGSMTNTLTLQKQEEAPRLYNLGVTECCRRLNVSASCQRACAFDVDLDAVLAMPECAAEMGKLMTCAADGSDHRRCCANKIVPGRCLNWCRGQPVAAAEECALGYAKEIVDCFEEGRAVLPGPPVNVRVEAVSSNVVRVRWDAPTKNADKVEVYRVYWRAPGDKISSRNDTRSTSLRISRLRAGVEYECAVKSGNHYGSSQLTAPLLFVPGRIFVSSKSTENYYIGTGTVLAVVLLLLLVLVMMLVGVVLYRRKRRKAAAGDRVSFENPSYLREMNLENLQHTSESSFTGGLNGSTGTNGILPNGDTGTNGSTGHQQAARQSNGSSQSASPARFGALRNGLGLVAKKAGFKQFENEQ